MTTVFSIDPAPLPKLSPDRLRRAVSRGINYGTKRARAETARTIAAQVAFPRGYLANRPGRLWVSRRASQGDLTGAVSARRRPTMLSRFMVSRPRYKVPARVMVAPGRTRTMPGTFLMKLRGGNVGLVLRTRRGRMVRNKRESARELWPGSNLYLLYGPSVQQAFLTDRETGVAVDKAPRIAEDTAKEIIRQLQRGLV